jgi:hypothetical protein
VTYLAEVSVDLPHHRFATVAHFPNNRIGANGRAWSTVWSRAAQ